MENALFTTNPHSLVHQLKETEGGNLQLPNIQRSWDWGEDRLSDLLESISHAFITTNEIETDYKRLTLMRCSQSLSKEL